ncbi:UDP-4-amino-4,6-dideoxy-N-acetyl-beta-L-altrosamine transaminase [Polyangium aurulentum]|uniref:UDP-4-amino-4, 6-dideoxy-N-acetyl-beta-L-altrosamine transaminase n=1 Tax=Polyangium aurulentum TaxID=2567896 RepID=UPI0010ADEAF5|nr:UDP-4-amino-4,6-dideoxy-N-acetyl-beta-L-altrosamine transaminase [Polyangium aurulentum]UQA58063.1 UDP-4-amino-4,6-dideoxy-N-acetyl-beta-L-altrosamine transaminase [Polyangium aurulentum]
MTDPQSFLPYGRHSIDEEDVAAVVAVLRGGMLTQGPEIDAFEADVARAVGARFAVAFSNGTAALHAACAALGLGPEDEVITTPFTFSASANCVRYVGAKPVFVDVEPVAGTIDPELVARAIGPRTRAIIPVHFAGQPARMNDLSALAQQHGLAIIEDAAHALGATYRGEPIGDGKRAAMAMFSFHPVKHVTTGEGGAITTNDEALRDKLRLFRTHGITRDPRLLTRPSPGPWYQEQIMLGYNYRLTGLQAALGQSQLKKLGRFVSRRRELAAKYDAMFEGVKGIRPLGRLEGTEHAFHIYVARIDFEGLGRSRAAVMEALKARGIGTQVHYVPVHLHPDYAFLGLGEGAFPVTERIYTESLTLPLFPAMNDGDVDRVVGALREVLGV